MLLSIFKANISAFVAILTTAVSLLQDNLQHHCVRCNFENRRSFVTEQFAGSPCEREIEFFIRV
jgi:hypothetical protein